MHRVLLNVAVYKFLVAVLATTATMHFDPVILTSALLTAMSSVVVRVVQEGEVALVLVALILLLDSIGLLLSFTTPSASFGVTYAVMVVWDIYVLYLMRQLIQ
ncbi:MAG: hypothetical protein QXP31_09490 [Pyrobaculum sp.]